MQRRKYAYKKNTLVKENMESVSKLAPMVVKKFIKKHHNRHAVNLNGTIYVLGGPDSGGKNVVQKFTPGISEKWTRVGEIPSFRSGYAVCSFLSRIYILGGTFSDHDPAHCLCFDPLTGEHDRLPGTMRERRFAACTAFGDKILLLGGSVGAGGRYHGRRGKTRTVEAFDPDLNRWTAWWSDMVEERTIHHRAVAVGSKVYVFGGGGQRDAFSIEVCDVTSGKFALLKRVTLLNVSGNAR